MLKLEYIRNATINQSKSYKHNSFFSVVGVRRGRALIELMRNKLSSIYSCTKLLHHVFCYGAFAPNENYDGKTNTTRHLNWRMFDGANAGDEKCESSFLYSFSVVYFITLLGDVDAVLWVYRDAAQANNLMKIFAALRCVYWCLMKMGRLIAIARHSILHCSSFASNQFISIHWVILSRWPSIMCFHFI